MALSGKGQNVLISWGIKANTRSNYSPVLLLAQDLKFSDTDKTEQNIWQDWFFEQPAPASEIYDSFGMMGFFGV